MKISVIIVNFNGEEFIGDCVSSVLRSDYKNLEVIVVDNASTDGSCEILRKFKKVKLVRSNKQLYFTGGCNLGARKATGEKLIFLNSDCVVTSGWISEMVKFAGDHNKRLVQPKILRKDGVIDNAGTKYNIFGIARGRGYGEKDLGQYDRNEEVQVCAGTCFMIDKKFFWEMGGFDESFRYQYEDVDLCLRARKMGGKCFLCYKSVVYHAGGATFKENVSNDELLFNIRKNRLAVVKKNFVGAERVLRLALVLIVNLFSRFKTEAFLVLSSFIFCFIVFEILLRTGVFDNTGSQNPVWIPPRFQETSKQINYCHNLFANSDYYNFTDRDREKEKKKDGYRIAVLGDSYIWGWGVLPNDIWSYKLERKVLEKYENVEVLSWGRSAWSTKDEFNFFKTEGIKYHPDLLIVGFVGNDFDMTERGKELLPDAKVFAPIRILFPNAYSFIVSYTYQFLRKNFSAGEEMLSKENLDKYGLLLSEFSDFARKNDTELLFVLTTSSNDYFYNRDDLIISMLEKAGIDFLDLYPEMVSRFKDKTQRDLWANPGDPHPGSELTSFYAEEVFKYLEEKKLIGSKAL